MRLSKLHIAGFKSFAERAELGFDQGVTAIVGPNGCGKSNVVDAITWVLGEQSAKSLRGERMEDVIFSGSEARKPTATAEVRLKFTQVRQAMRAAVEAPDAPDADPLLDEQPVIARDVEIGRRLYRSGESEYLIDGEVCRLKDVHELLMDSGLGVKAYAVIEQGKIGQILSSRPAERRMLIEEAAGVTKYKARRRAAELKLEAAEHNLTRVDDVIFEVEKQRGTLKRQAARARRYRRLREELRKWEQVQFARRYEMLRGQITDADTRLEAARAREVGAAARVAELETALEGLRLNLTAAEARATAARDDAHARELAIGRRQQQIAFEGQQVVELTQQAEAFEAEATSLDARRGPLHESLAAQREAAGTARASLDEAARRVEEGEAAYRRALAGVQEVERSADETRAAVLSAATTLSALSQARDHAAAVRDRVAAERERLEIEARELDAEIARARDAHVAARESLETARAARDETVARRTGAEASLADMRATRARAAQDRAARERDLAAREARLRSLEELEARRATFGDAARLLLADEAEAIRHQGAVADHLVVERTFERAVDALLGDLLQHVVVERAEDAMAGLAFVAERQAGRCGFVVLDRMDAGAPAAGAEAPPAGARALADIVRATGPHAARLQRLLDRAWVVDSAEAAIAVARGTTGRVATTSGEVFGAPWLVEGGARQDVRGILETRAEIQELRQEAEAVAAAIETLSSELASLDEQTATAQTLLETLVAAQHSHEKDIVAFEAQVARSADERDRVSRRFDVVTAEHQRAVSEHANTEQRREEAIAAIVTHEEQMRVAEDGLSEVLGRLQAARGEAEAAMRQVTALRTEQATLIERASGLEAEVGRLVAAAAELDERIEGRRADVGRLQARCADLRASVAAGQAALDEDVQTLADLRATVVQVDEQVTELRQEFEGRDHDIRTARQALDAVRAEVLQSEVARATATSDLSHLETTCVEAVGLALEEVSAAVATMRANGELVPPATRLVTAGDEEDVDAAPEPGGQADGSDVEAAGDVAAEIAPDEAQAQVADVDADDVIGLLRRRIERLGPVNMMAIEQFDELETRHAFLTTQRQDLLDSIAQTGEAIRKIDKTTRERFAEAFELINRNFEQTFTTLFGGGRAGLVLIDQENEQESGIDIIAQPPGKRLQNVQLLSGGEKALTAMALMFAVFKHRPSPFCLLDEIDAPLDDANIGRFVAMLQGMQEHTQFILVTHHRKTMEIADRLYGVTMEEPGVSKLISVQLN
ncbi:MAG: chromosome segregation protein SMC [Acidobacteria bacterium SCN 69-37]|nr:MAG: chromosome segregation protein SMC [Acidobacteria bacterium SCN 69-37]